MHDQITPYWLQDKRTAERFIKTLKIFKQTCVVINKKWKVELGEFLTSYRATPLCTTGFSPSSMLLKSRFKTFVPELTFTMNSDESSQGKFVDNDTRNKLKVKEYADEGVMLSFMI